MDAVLGLLNDDYVSVIPEELRWRAWAADSEGITGDALKDFVDNRLFPGLQNLDVTGSDGESVNRRAVLVRDIFAGTNNYMKNGTIIRQVVNKLNEIDFNAPTPTPPPSASKRRSRRSKNADQTGSSTMSSHSATASLKT